MLKIISIYLAMYIRRNNREFKKPFKVRNENVNKFMQNKYIRFEGRQISLLEFYKKLKEHQLFRRKQNYHPKEQLLNRITDMIDFNRTKIFTIQNYLQDEEQVYRIVSSCNTNANIVLAVTKKSQIC